MKIAIIGTGNVGSALASAISKAGHTIFLGVRNKSDFKGKHLLSNPNIQVFSIPEASSKAEVIILAVPSAAAISVAHSLGVVKGKVLIDTMNLMKQGSLGNFTNTTDAILANTDTLDVVKCFNTTGNNNMQNPLYDGTAIDAFVAGDSEKGKSIAKQLAEDTGFAQCYDIGGNEKFEMMEQFAKFWITLAGRQKHGREIGFKLLGR